VQVHRLACLRHPDTDFIPAPFALRILNVMPQRTVLLVVVATDIISPPCRLHKQENPEASPAIGWRTRLQHRFYLSTALGLLLKDLEGNDPAEHMAGDIQESCLSFRQLLDHSKPRCSTRMVHDGS
jgi:hypothetical protein